MAELDKSTPQFGLRFRNLEEAWVFWVAYGGHAGFDVRRRYSNVSKFDGKVTSCRYVCANEGYRRKGLKGHVTKCFRAETRTNCKAQMTLTLDRGEGNYEVTDVVLEHNHLLQLPETCHLMASQRKISELQAFEIETADDSGIRPKAAHELTSRQVGGPLNLGYTVRDRKNYLQSKRQRELAFGQAGSSRALEDNKYGVAIGSLHGDLSFEEERIVIGDPLNQKASCDCGMFNRTGLLCAHGLKVLDLMNINLLPSHYILKRWTREARNGSIQDREGRNVVENPKREAQIRYKFLSHKFHNLADKAANSQECCVLLENALDCLTMQLEEKLNISTSAANEPCKGQENVDPNVDPNLLATAKLKKKEIQSKNSRRQKTWLDKLRKKGKRKAATSTALTKKKEQSNKRKVMMCNPSCKCRMVVVMKEQIRSFKSTIPLPISPNTVSGSLH